MQIRLEKMLKGRCMACGEKRGLEGLVIRARIIRFCRKCRLGVKTLIEESEVALEEAKKGKAATGG